MNSADQTNNGSSGACLNQSAADWVQTFSNGKEEGSETLSIDLPPFTMKPMRISQWTSSWSKFRPKVSTFEIFTLQNQTSHIAHLHSKIWQPVLASQESVPRLEPTQLTSINNTSPTGNRSPYLSVKLLKVSVTLLKSFSNKTS